MNKLARIFSSGIAFIALITGLAALPAHVLAATTTVSVSAPAQVNAGQTFNVTISVAPGQSIAGVQCNLGFDGSLLTATNVSEGNLLNQNGAATYFMPGSIGTGSVNGIAGVITSPGGTVSGTGTFASISFTAGTSTGTSALTLSGVIIGDANASPIAFSASNTQVAVAATSTNHAPVLSAIGNKQATVGLALTFTISATDQDGNSLTYSASGLPSGATFNTSTRIFSWTPAANQAATFSGVTFQVSDGQLMDSESITITVTALATNGCITVISPNGGENWQPGTTHAVQWTATNVSGTVQIQLLKSGVPVLIISSAASASAGMRNWTIGNLTIVGTDYSIAVISNTNPAVMDTSDGYFGIGATPTPTQPKPASLTVVSPKGSENWTAGSTQIISWTATSLSGNVKIELLKSGTVVLTVASSVSVSPGSYACAIPASQTPGTDYTVRITSLSTPSVSASSSASFTISAPPPPPPASLTVASPNGGENWTDGSTQTISWTSASLSGNVKIELLKSGTVVLTVASSVSVSPGSYAWAIPASQTPGSDYTVRITSLSMPTVSASSSASFSINAAVAQPLTVVLPAIGQTWNVGTVQMISWTSVNLTGTLTIELEKAGVPMFIASSAASVSAGARSWSVPRTLVSGSDYQIIIISNTNPAVFATSAAFTIA